MYVYVYCVSLLCVCLVKLSVTFVSIHDAFFSFFPFFLTFFPFSESLGLRGKVMRKIEELKAALVGSATPDEFLCPITQEVMKDPVIAAGEPTTCSPVPQATLYLQKYWITY